MRFLAEQGVDVEKPNRIGQTALFLAASKNHLAMLHYLADELNVDKEKSTSIGNSPLCGAAAEGHLSAVQYLVQKGCDLHHANDDGCCPLFQSAQNDNKPRSGLSVIYFFHHNSHHNQHHNFRDSKGKYRCQLVSTICFTFWCRQLSCKKIKQ